METHIKNNETYINFIKSELELFSTLNKRTKTKRIDVKQLSNIIKNIIDNSKKQLENIKEMDNIFLEVNPPQKRKPRKQNEEPLNKLVDDVDDKKIIQNEELNEEPLNKLVDDNELEIIEYNYANVDCIEMLLDGLNILDNDNDIKISRIETLINNLKNASDRVEILQYIKALSVCLKGKLEEPIGKIYHKKVVYRKKVSHLLSLFDKILEPLNKIVDDVNDKKLIQNKELIIKKLNI